MPPQRRGRTVLGVAVGVVLVAAAVGLGYALLTGDDEPAPQAGGGGTSAQATRPPAPPATTQREFTRGSAADAFRDIVELRYEALRRLDVSILEEIYLPECSCLKRDRDIVAELRKDGLHLQDSNFTLREVEVASFEEVGKVAVIEFTAEFSGSTYANEAGKVVRREEGSGVGRYQANLAWDGNSWRQALAVRVG